MVLGRVIGTVVATRKDERLLGCKLLVVRPIGIDGKDEKGHLIAIDTVGAGVREIVLVVQGSSARMAFGCKDCPTDAAIIGIVDTVEVDEGSVVTG
jgi:ethanolamine utilization protein EutN